NLEGEFSREAFAAESPAKLGNRCTVFMESDLVAHQQQGATRGDLCAGLARSVVTNYLEKVAAGHPPGKRILFLGGVAENPAVAAALEEELEAPVATSPFGRVSGAIGAAMIAFERRRDGLYSKSSFSPLAFGLSASQFTCEECPNRCSITRVGPGGAPVEGAQCADFFFGGRCGRWDGAASARCAPQNSPLRRRLALVDSRREGFAPKMSPHVKRVGIPRALFAFDRLPEWRAFFEGIGCEVVVSPPSNDEMFAEGMRRLVVENCLPVKALSAHIAWLDLHGGVDFIFVPSFVNTGEDRFGKETAHCPYIQGARQFAAAVAKTPLISPSINWRWNPSDEEEAMLSQAASLGAYAGRARAAFREAKEVADAQRRELASLGEAVLKSLAEGKIQRAFVLIGKDYNVLDMRLNSRAPEMLESMGETVITQDMLCDDSGLYSEAWRTMCWSHGKEILAAAEIAAKTPGLYPVFITSFGCGPDSFTAK
nr:acyl-CoA dehydratase activase-related protein [bacterium]